MSWKSLRGLGSGLGFTAPGALHLLIQRLREDEWVWEWRGSREPSASLRLSREEEGPTVPLLSCCDLTLSSLARSFPSIRFLTFAGLCKYSLNEQSLKVPQLWAGTWGTSGPGKGQNWAVIRGPIPPPPPTTPNRGRMGGVGG